MSQCFEQTDLFLSEGREHKSCHFLGELTLDQRPQKIDVGMWKQEKRALQVGDTARARGHERITREERRGLHVAGAGTLG